MTRNAKGKTGINTLSSISEQIVCSAQMLSKKYCTSSGLLDKLSAIQSSKNERAIPGIGRQLQTRTIFTGCLFCVFFLLLGSCHTDALSINQYINWLKDNNEKLSVTIPKGALNFRIEFQPLEIMALRELGEFEHVKPAIFDSVLSEYRGLEYYQLSIRGASDLLQYGISDKQEFYERVEYYSFQMQNDLRMIVAQDTMSCKLFHFERNYGTAPFVTFSLAFEVPEVKGDRRIQYHESVFGYEWIEMTLLQENIDNIPTIKL